MVETNLPVLFLRNVVILPYNELRIELSSEIDKKIVNISENNQLNLHQFLRYCYLLIHIEPFYHHHSLPV